MTRQSLVRLRWFVRGVLTLGVLVSGVANVLHAVHNPISQAIAAWPPIALLFTVELISRIPVHTWWLAALRWVFTGVVALIAAWVSYWHMAGVAGRYGETGTSPYLLPVSVDGLIVVASICLVELSGRIGADEPASAAAVAVVWGMVFDHLRPIGPEPVREPILSHHVIQFDHERPIGPMAAPREQPRRRVAKPRSAAAERVTAAHTRAPGATNAQIAERAKVSVSTVKRYRPAVAEPIGAAA